MAETNNYTKMGSKELKKEIEKKEKELVLLRFANKANQLKDTSSIKKTRKEIARINTVLNQK